MSAWITSLNLCIVDHINSIFYPLPFLFIFGQSRPEIYSHDLPMSSSYELICEPTYMTRYALHYLPICVTCVNAFICQRTTVLVFIIIKCCFPNCCIFNCNLYSVFCCILHCILYVFWVVFYHIYIALYLVCIVFSTAFSMIQGII